MMAEHEHGHMDISTQEKTFAGFIKGIIWVASISLGILIFLAVFNT